MAEITIEEVRAYLKGAQGREIDLDKLRLDLQIDRGSKSWSSVRMMMLRLAEQRVVKPSGRKDGVYKVIPQVNPVRVFGINHNRELAPLVFPKEYDTGKEMPLLDNVIVRGGDLILIAGVSNYGKTALAMNFLAENINIYDCVLMGNEYVTADGQPTPRFISRLESMEQVGWVNAAGEDKFTLLPVMSDFAEYVQKNKLNIIDWINIETGEHYMIGKVLEDIKRGVGNKGIAVVVIQKSELSDSGRGGQFTKDFADVELLIDKHGEHESRLTIGKVKEYSKYITGKSVAYTIANGVKLLNIREVVKCPSCYGKKWKKMGNTSIPCPDCFQIGYINK